MSRQSFRRSEGERVQPDELTVGTQTVRPADATTSGPEKAPRFARPMRWVADVIPGVLVRDRLVLAFLVGLAALVRLPFLAARGSWDADQGHDMLVLRAFVRDGVVPLLGPPTSIGDFHHGALYYFLLAPAAALSGADPTAVVFEIALAGIAAVAVTWWLARSIGGPTFGPIAGLIAGGLMAVSPSAIETSTFIWNPNLIPLAAALAYTAAWRARTTGHARWWTAAVAAAGVVMQLHVLGAIFLVAILGVAVLAPGPVGRRRSLAAAAVGIAVVVLTYLPLLIYELGHDWAETRNVIAYFTGSGAQPSALDPAQRLVFTAFRAIGWPLVGLITDVPLAAVAAVAVVIALAVWRARAGRDGERFAVRWFGWTLVWAIIALTVMAPSLATVIEGLPNDHYHAYLDPAVFALIGLGGTALITAAHAAVDRTARAVAIIGLAGLVLVDVSQWPPIVATDGGWPGARSAAEKILAVTGERPIALSGLPTFKTTEGVEFPLRQLGGRVESPATAGALVVACDRLFERIMQADCGGPAEDKVVGTSERFVKLVERFDLSSRTSISIYLPRQ